MKLEDVGDRVALHWARVRIDAALHELHLAQVLIESIRVLSADDLETVGRALRKIRDRLW